MKRKLVLIVACPVILLLAGCASSPSSKFYTLGTSTSPGQTQAKAATVVTINAVVVPELVDRPQIVTRSAANQVSIDEFNRWAEPLKSQIPAVIATNLTQLLDGALVYAYPQSTNVDPDYRVSIDVQRFDSTLGDAVTIEVLWTVRAGKDGAPKSGRTVAREKTTGDGYDELVAAHGKALATVSREIAAAISATKP